MEVEDCVRKRRKGGENLVEAEEGGERGEGGKKGEGGEGASRGG